MLDGSAAGVPDQHRPAETVQDLPDGPCVSGPVQERTGIGTVTRQVDRDGIDARTRQQIDQACSAPRAMPGAVDEHHRRGAVIRIEWFATPAGPRHIGGSGTGPRHTMSASSARLSEDRSGEHIGRTGIR
jgi:hypothetical protein